MSIGLARMEGLWCGQGMAHLLKLYHDPYADPDRTAPDMMALFDFGTSDDGLDQSREVLGVASPVKTIIDALQLQMKAGKTPTLDLVLFSHQDEDHWKLIGELLEQVNIKKIPLSITNIIYGGTGWKPKAKATIGSLETYISSTPKKAKALSSGYSDYKYSATGPTITLSLDDVHVRTLIACAPSAKKSVLNGSSAVVLIELKNQGFILPGDATFQTLVAASTKLKLWPTSPLPFVYMLSAPHHGALSTMTRKNLGDASGLPELDEFIGLTRPYSTFASAGEESSYKHPYLIVMESVSKYASSYEFPEPHNVVVYEINGDHIGWRVIRKTNRNAYTTVTDLKDPLPTADWLFEINSLGHFRTSARFFEGGQRVIDGIPEADPTTLANDGEDEDMGDGTFSSTVDARTTRPHLLTRNPLPDPIPGHAVRSTGGLFAARTPVAPGRAEPAHRFGVTARPLPPNRRVRVAASGDGR
jgi:beta-lactamase superfamily II metal-dependent hydrolase